MWICSLQCMFKSQSVNRTSVFEAFASMRRLFQNHQRSQCCTKWWNADGREPSTAVRFCSRLLRFRRVGLKNKRNWICKWIIYICGKDVQISILLKCYNVEFARTCVRSKQTHAPEVTNKSIAASKLVDRAWFCIGLTRYLKRTLFNQYSGKYIKIIHQLVGNVGLRPTVYSLVPLAMADHRLEKQMPRRCCNMFSYYCVTVMI